MECEKCIHYEVCEAYKSDAEVMGITIHTDNCKFYKRKELNIELPCKVGDTVYKTSYDCDKGVRYNPFNEYGCSTAEICCKCGTYPCNLHKAVIPIIAENQDWIWNKKSDFGKTVFLHRKDAEKKLEANNG